MARNLALVWANARNTSGLRITASMLVHLAEALVQQVRDEQWQAARGTMALYQLSPIALGVVAERMWKAGISEDAVLRLL